MHYYIYQHYFKYLIFIYIQWIRFTYLFDLAKKITFYIVNSKDIINYKCIYILMWNYKYNIIILDIKHALLKKFIYGIQREITNPFSNIVIYITFDFVIN